MLSFFNQISISFQYHTDFNYKETYYDFENRYTANIVLAGIRLFLTRISVGNRGVPVGGSDALPKIYSIVTASLLPSGAVDAASLEPPCCLSHSVAASTLGPEQLRARHRLYECLLQVHSTPPFAVVFPTCHHVLWVMVALPAVPRSAYTILPAFFALSWPQWRISDAPAASSYASTALFLPSDA